MDFRTDRIMRLYRAMPGAPQPPFDERGELWGEVMGNDHWLFCEMIIDAIDRVSGKGAK